ncbi:unnamed protein product [Leptosia nina]|uniref:NTF2 domain-containing protein n=1 Tax=Leptosia nina TaxID=320188 RepID=A0AAV1J5I8_9NEOP
MPNDTETTKLKKKRVRSKRKRFVSKNLKWTRGDAQVPGNTFVNSENSTLIQDSETSNEKFNISQRIETDELAKKNSDPPETIESTKPEVKQIETLPVRNIQTIESVQKGKIKKDTGYTRNIQIHMNNADKPKGKPIPYITNRSKGIPNSFLRVQNITAIVPQNTVGQESTLTKKHEPVWSLNNLTENDSTSKEPLRDSIPTYSQASLGQLSTIYGQAVPMNNQPMPVFVPPTHQMLGLHQQIINQPAGMFGQPMQMYAQPTQLYNQQMTPNFTYSTPVFEPAQPTQHMYVAPNAMLVDVDNNMIATPKEQYSPTDIYNNINEEVKDNDNDSTKSDSPVFSENKKKRLSAFDRLGPQTSSKKPMLTINLCLGKDSPTREVVDKTKHLPVYERDDIMTSTDPTVVKFRYCWPWKGSIPLKRSVTHRSSKTVMMMEKEQVEEEYKNDNVFMIVSVKGYPPSWTKENVLDTILENLKDLSFIPCFIEFSIQECKFLVNRCRAALLALHYLGFSIRTGDVELTITISVTLMNTKQLEYIPRLVIRNRLQNLCLDDKKKANLKEFTLKSDVSNFIYFPLNRLSNQGELMDLVHGLNWDYLQDLDLSYNRLTSIKGFNLLERLPKLQHLNLSHNLLDDVKILLPLRGLLLKTLWLENNPLCLNYVDGDYYIKVIKTLFPCLRELDGVFIPRRGEMPKFIQHYCLQDARPMIEDFLEIYFRLLDLDPDQRNAIEGLYHKDAMLTVTSRKKLRYSQDYSQLRHLFLRNRCIEEGNLDYVLGPEKISKLILKWPTLQHDPHSCTVDVLMHNKSSTLLRVTGILKIRATCLADDEQLISFTRTVLLVCEDDLEYKIKNEMLYFDEPNKEIADNSFRVAIVSDIFNNFYYF